MEYCFDEMFHFICDGDKTLNNDKHRYKNFSNVILSMDDKNQFFLYKFLDVEAFPDVTLTLHDLKDDSEYDNLEKSLELLLTKKEQFSIYVETIHVRNMNIKYLYRFGKFLNEINKKSDQIKLKEVKINVYDNIVYGALFTLFTFITKPIVEICICFYEGGYNDLSGIRKIKKIKIFKPNVKK